MNNWVTNFYYFICFPGPVFKLSKLEKQQQRKEKTRTKGNSESSKDRGALHSKVNTSVSDEAEGELSSEKGKLESFVMDDYLEQVKTNPTWSFLMHIKLQWNLGLLVT